MVDIIMHEYSIGHPSIVFSTWTLAQLYLHMDAISGRRARVLAEDALFRTFSHAAVVCGKRGAFIDFVSNLERIAVGKKGDDIGFGASAPLYQFDNSDFDTNTESGGGE